MTVLVTGGASGIGLSVAASLAADRPVIIGDVDASRATAAADDLRRSGGKVTAVPMDVRRPSDCDRAVRARDPQEPPLSAIAHCAGTITGDGALADVASDEWDRIVGTNLTGAANVVRAALPHLLANERSQVVLVSSIGALRGRRRSAAYAASKAGLLGLARSLVADYGARGLRANCVCPGPTATPMTDGLSLRPPANASGRVAEPGEIASAIVWLLSPEAGWVNGVELVVDDGETATSGGVFPTTNRRTRG